MAVRIARKLGELEREIDNLGRETHDLIVLLNGLGFMENDVYKLARQQVSGKVDKVENLIERLVELKEKMRGLPERTPEPAFTHSNRPPDPIKIPEVLVEQTKEDKTPEALPREVEVKKIRIPARKSRGSRR